jgi:hypothetical protein
VGYEGMHLETPGRYTCLSVLVHWVWSQISEIPVAGAMGGKSRDVHGYDRRVHHYRPDWRVTESPYWCSERWTADNAQRGPIMSRRSKRNKDERVRVRVRAPVYDDTGRKRWGVVELLPLPLPLPLFNHGTAEAWNWNLGSNETLETPRRTAGTSMIDG